MGRNVVKALDHVNIEIYSGELIIIFGPSGCGKSTFLNMIAGLDTPTSGEIYIRGERLSGKTPKELAKHRRTKLGMVFQQFNLIPSMNVVENVALPLVFDGVPKKRRMKRAENIIDNIGMGKWKPHTPSELSGGQQQKIAIARALVANPWILLADEPTGNIDSKSANEILKLLVLLCRKSKRTILMVTHNPDYRKYADRVIYFKDGMVQRIKVNRVVRGVEEGKEWIISAKSSILTEEQERAKEKAQKRKKKQRLGSKNEIYRYH